METPWHTHLLVYKYIFAGSYRILSVSDLKYCTKKCFKKCISTYLIYNNDFCCTVGLFVCNGFW